MDKRVSLMHDSSRAIYLSALDTSRTLSKLILYSAADNVPVKSLMKRTVHTKMQSFQLQSYHESRWFIQRTSVYS